MSKTLVYLTVDVECAEERRIRGGVQPPLGYDLRVWGKFENHPRGIGVGLLMDELEAHGARGTFYVEPFGTSYFGEEGLGEVVGEMRRRGHDVQLHAHPVQQRIDWISRRLEPPPDDMADYDVDDQAALLARGMDILERCGVPRGELVSFRAGNFGANNETWKAMHRVGLRVSSNFNACYLSRNCRISWPRIEQALFDTCEGVWELPISNFVEADGTTRHLQIVAVSLAEMVSFLKQARRLGISDVVLVTHSFEMYYMAHPESRRARLSRINLSRLRGLLEYLGEHRSDYEVTTVGELAARLPQPMAAGSTSPVGPVPLPSPKSGFVLRAGRLFEQAMKRAATGFKLRSFHDKPQ